MTVSTVTLRSRIQRADGLVSADVGQELVMLHIAKSTYLNTNAVGRDIWRSIERPVQVDELCAALVQRYEVDPERCAADVLAFLNDAYREGIVRIVD